MATRRDVLQLAAATAAIAGVGGWSRAFAQQRLTEADLLAFTRWAAHPPAHRRHPRAAEAALLPRAVAQPRRRRRPRQAAPRHRHGAAQRLRDSRGLARRLHAELGRLRGAGPDLRPRRRHGPHGDARQCDPRRARRRARAAARRRRRPAGLVHGARDQGRRHGQRAGRRWAWRRPPATGSSRWARGRVAELFGDVDRPGSSSLAFLAGNVRDTDFDEPVFNSTRMFEQGRRRPSR